MSLASPATANTPNKSRTIAWISARRAWLQIALLLLSTGVFYAAVTVVAARGPDPMDAYAPPPPPGAFHLSPAQDIDTTVAAPASSPRQVATGDFVSADPSVVAPVPAISTEVVPAPATMETEADTSTEDQTAIDAPATPTATSSAVESPELVASSWSMDPLPEGEGGTVASSTSIDPITPTSSMVASPQ